MPPYAGGRGDSPIYVLSAAVSPVVLFALVVAVAALVEGNWPDLRSLGHPGYLPYIAMGLLVTPMLLTVAAVGSVVYSWLYNGTRGSLVLLVLFHGLFDFFSVWEGGVIGAGPVMTVCMVFWAVRAYKLYGPAILCPGDKVVIP